MPGIGHDNLFAAKVQYHVDQSDKHALLGSGTQDGVQLFQKPKRFRIQQGLVMKITGEPGHKKGGGNAFSGNISNDNTFFTKKQVLLH